jgi:hypothetical protein
VANNATTITNEAKDWEAEASEVDAAGEEGAFPVTVLIFTFMPWLQWPNVPQAKYLVPALFNLTTSLPLFKEFNALPRSQFL